MPHLSKPLSEFFTLDKKLSQQGIRFTLAPGETFLPPNGTLNDITIVIQHGAVSLHRSESNMLYGIVQNPAIFGLAAAVNKIKNDYMLIAETDCRGYYLPAVDTLQCLDRYHQIRSTLLMMMAWDERIRARIGVLNFIQQRTRISRSVIAEVLSALRKGDYIKMEKGKLVGITRLPYDY